MIRDVSTTSQRFGFTRLLSTRWRLQRGLDSIHMDVHAIYLNNLQVVKTMACRRKLILRSEKIKAKLRNKCCIGWESLYYTILYYTVQIIYHAIYRKQIRGKDGLPWWSPSQVLAAICCVCTVKACMRVLLCLVFLITAHLCYEVICWPSPPLTLQVAVNSCNATPPKVGREPNTRSVVGECISHSVTVNRVTLRNRAAKDTRR